jgi:hypothetical protein
MDHNLRRSYRSLPDLAVGPTTHHTQHQKYRWFFVPLSKTNYQTTEVLLVRKRCTAVFGLPTTQPKAFGEKIVLSGVAKFSPLEEKQNVKTDRHADISLELHSSSKDDRTNRPCLIGDVERRPSLCHKQVALMNKVPVLRKTSKSL